MMELKPTNHHYYSSENNFYVGNHNGENFGRSEYDTWEEFKDDWFCADGTLDDDYNHVFRFDIFAKLDRETDEEIPGQFELWLFFVLQRKGIYRPVWIKEISEADISEIEKFLRGRWEYMKHQWEEFV